MRGISRYLAPSSLTILLAAACSRDAPDQKWVSDTTGISFVIPGDHSWKVQPPEGVTKISLRAKKGLVTYSEMPQKEPVTVTRKAGEFWEGRYLTASRGNKLSGAVTTFHGRPAYEFEEQHTDPGSGAQNRTKGILCSIGNTLFSIMATTAGITDPGDPFQDPVIKKFIHSIQIPDSSQPASGAQTLRR